MPRDRGCEVARIGDGSFDGFGAALEQFDEGGVFAVGGMQRQRGALVMMHLC